MRILRLYTGCLFGQPGSGTVTGHAFGHIHRFVFFHFAVALDTVDIFERVDVACREAASEGTGVIRSGKMTHQATFVGHFFGGHMVGR